MAIDKRKNVNKHFPESEETQKGHMRNLHKNMRSTSRTTKKKKTSVNTLHPADAIRLHYAKTDFRLDGGSAAQISQPSEHTTIRKPIKNRTIFSSKCKILQKHCTHTKQEISQCAQILDNSTK